MADDWFKPMPERDPDPVLTVDGAAKLLGLSTNTVYAAAARGEIPHRRVGRKILFSRAGLLAWLGRTEP